MSKDNEYDETIVVILFYDETEESDMFDDSDYTDDYAITVQKQNYQKYLDSLLN